VTSTSLVLASLLVTTSVPRELSVTVCVVKISDEIVGLAVLVDKISVPLTDSVSTKIDFLFYKYRSNEID
jgi:hypothetical protein